MQGPQRRRVGQSRGQERHAGPCGLAGDAVEPGELGVVVHPWETHGVEILLRLERTRSEQCTRAPLAGPVRSRDAECAEGRDGDGRAGIGQVGDDLQCTPQACMARQRHGMESQRDDVVHRRGGEDRQAKGPRHLLTRAGEGRRLRHGVVPDEGHGAAEWGRTRDVGVADGIGRPIETRILSVPEAHHAVDPTSGQLARQLCPTDGGRGQLLVQSGCEDDVRLRQQVVRPLELLVEPAQGGAFVAADEERSRQIPGAIEVPLGQEEADERLYAGEQHRAFRGLVAVTDAHGTHRLSVLFVSVRRRERPRTPPHGAPIRSKCSPRQSTRPGGGMGKVVVFPEHDATEAAKKPS